MAQLFFKLIRASRLNLEHPDEHIEIRNPNGIQFCHRNDIPRAVQENPDYTSICEVIVPKGQLIECYKQFKWRSTRLLLRNAVPIQKFIEENYCPSYIVDCNPENVKFINDTMLDTEMWRELEIYRGGEYIGKDGMRSQEKFFIHLRRLTYKNLFIRAIQVSPHVLEYAVLQEYEICEAAVKLDGICLKYIRSWNSHLARIAVSQNGMALAWCLEQTSELCIAAVRQNPIALCLVKNKTEEICREAVSRNGYAIQYMKPQSLECARLALLQNGAVFGLLSPDAQRVFGGERRAAAEALDRSARMA